LNHQYVANALDVLPTNGGYGWKDSVIEQKDLHYATGNATAHDHLMFNQVTTFLLPFFFLNSS